MIKTAKNFLSNTILFFCTLLFGFLILEFGLRSLHWQSTAEYQAIQAQDGIQTVTTSEFQFSEKLNSLGLRGEEIHAPMPGEKRVVFLGDSITFGLGVSEKEGYVSKLKELFFAKNIYFINAGKGGSHPGERFLFLKEHKDILSPDFIVLQIYLGNDPYDALFYMENNHLVQAAQPVQENLKLKKIIKKSKAVTFLWERMRVSIWILSDKIPWLRHFLLERGIRNGPQALLLKKYYPLEVQGMQKVLDAILDIKEVCDEKKIKLLLVLVPFKEQFLTHNWPKGYDPHMPQNIILEFAEKHGLPAVDLLGFFENQPEEVQKTIYYNQDIHWNAQGHALAAEGIVSVLDKELAQ